jgi:PEP-CTERM motif
MNLAGRFNKFFIATGLLASSVCTNAIAGTILYSQNFENPNPGSFVNDENRDINVYRSINTLYGGQPAGFNFAQDFTVETLLVGGTRAFGTGYKDPQGRAGNYAIGMLSSAQNDLLGLSFNVGANKFLNFQVDVSSIDVDGFGGPFVPVGGLAPVFRFSLFNNPTGSAGVGSGTLLSSIEVTGTKNPSKSTFDWSNFIVALNATGNTNGNVILRIDSLAGGYSALDNFVISASDVAGDIGGTAVPLPTSLALLGGGMFLIGFTKRRKPSSGKV